MKKIELSVHEFMTIMGALDEKQVTTRDSNNSIYDEWFNQWKDLDERLEKLDMMAKANMLFDGKISINAISEIHLQQLIETIKNQVNIHKELINTNDEDADPDDLEMWTNRLTELNKVNSLKD